MTKGGRSRRLTAAIGRVSVRDVDYFWIKSADPETGYVLVPRTVPAGTTTEVVRPAVQPAAPAPGPTLVLRLARRDRGFTTHTLQVAIAIASSASQAASLAKTLR